MGLFDLPENWVYVEFENGERKNIANTDTLNEREATRFKEYWEEAEHKKIVKVTLETSDNKVIKTFTY